MNGRLLLVACVLVAGCNNDAAIVNAPEACGEPAAISSQSVLSAAGGGAVTGEELLTAMGGHVGATAPLFIGNASAAGVFSGLGEIEPTQGSTFAWLSTGVAGAGTDSAVSASGPTQFGTNFGLIDCAGAGTFDCALFRHEFTVAEGQHTVRFDFEFFSTEYPEFLGAGYNDRFIVSLASTTYNFANISVDEDGSPINVNSALFTDRDCEDFEGTGFDLDTGFGTCEAGATGLLGTIAPVEPGEVVTLTFTLADEGDALYDSAVMIDRLETTPNVISDPSTSDCD